MNDKITAITVNLNSLVTRLEWIREQNYNDPDAVDLMGDVAEWVKEIGEAVEAIEKCLTPVLRGRHTNSSPKEREAGTSPLTPLLVKERGIETQSEDSLSDGGVGTHPFIPTQEGKL